MKKHRLFAVLAAMSVAFALVLAGCQQPSSSGSNNTNTVKGCNDFSKAAVGDIVLTDGTFVTAASFTDEMKYKAAAVIVRAKNESTPALGVGIHHNTTGLAWCTNSAVGYNTNITALQGDETSGYTDGSDSWSILKDALGENDDTSDLSKYPAWDFCNTYATKYGLTGDLATDWYLPTVAELKTIYENKGTIDASLEKAGGDKFGKIGYWSCCQYSSNDKNAYGLNFGGGYKYNSNKDYDGYYVCSVRAFN